MNLIEALAVDVGPRVAGTDNAARAADTVADAFRELGLEPRFQEFQLVAYEPEQPQLEVDGVEWEAGACMYAHPGQVEGTVKRIGESRSPVGDTMLPVFAVVGDDGRERALLLTSPFSVGAIPFLTSHVQTATPPAAFVRAADAERLQDGMRARLRVDGRFVPGRRERNVVADIPGAADDHVLVTAHYDSVFRGPGAVDNASGVEGVRRVAERFVDRVLPRGVRLVAFAAEEIKLTGSRTYVDEARMRGELAQIAGMVNLDCIAHGDKLNVLASPDELLGRGVEAARALGLLQRYDLETGPATGGVDSNWFAQEKVPAVTLLHFPYDEYHLTSDTTDLVDERLIDDAVDLATVLVESQLERPVPRPR